MQSVKPLELRTAIYWDWSGSEAPVAVNESKLLKASNRQFSHLYEISFFYCGINLSPTRTLSWPHGECLILQMMLVLYQCGASSNISHRRWDCIKNSNNIKGSIISIISTFILTIHQVIWVWTILQTLCCLFSIKYQTNQPQVLEITLRLE